MVVWDGVWGAEARDWSVAAVFLTVYWGMFLGGLPKLKLDRTGVAVLGAIAVVAITGMDLHEAAAAVDLPTLVLLFAFMVISSQLHLSGFYAAVTRTVGAWALSPAALLGVLMGVAGVLSAVFSNDVICLAMTPVVVRVCWQRGLNPVPFALALACAANIGSAATLIGNPQNMLIGSVMQLSFAAYAVQAWAPVCLSLAVAWAWMVWAPRAWAHEGLTQTAQPMRAALAAGQESPLRVWDSAKGLSVALVLLGLFLFTDVNRELAALVGAGVLLLSRRRASAQVLSAVDGSLLLLFVGLFVVNHAMAQTGWAEAAVRSLAAQGWVLSEPTTLVAISALLSNLVSNVPAVMLLLPHLGPDAGVTLALASTFAGNLLLVGSIANLIVADLARQQGVQIGWRTHAQVGIPVTLGSLAVLMVWLR
jgi:Na+/H+ antiporter NhaD/arsenite permease-like protein